VQQRPHGKCCPVHACITAPHTAHKPTEISHACCTCPWACSYSRSSRCHPPSCQCSCCAGAPWLRVLRLFACASSVSMSFATGSSRSHSEMTAAAAAQLVERRMQLRYSHAGSNPRAGDEAETTGNAAAASAPLSWLYRSLPRPCAATSVGSGLCGRVPRSCPSLQMSCRICTSSRCIWSPIATGWCACHHSCACGGVAHEAVPCASGCTYWPHLFLSMASLRLVFPVPTWLS